MGDRVFPAIVVTWPAAVSDEAAELLLAAVDAHAPTAVEPVERGLRIFFNSPSDRTAAADAVVLFDATLGVAAVDVPDEQWAERSQAAVRAVQVGALTIAPPWDVPPGRDVIIIQPSMGFGTGHHASTRLCLRLLQDHAVAGARVLDVGTGSGVLAIAASTLGASRVLAIDCDRDALTSAGENLALNGVGAAVQAEYADLLAPESELSGATFDIVLGNLTGAVLTRHASRLAAWLAPGGTLIVSGFGPYEAAEVTDAFAAAGLAVTSRADEGEWTGLKLS